MIKFEPMVRRSFFITVENFDRGKKWLKDKNEINVSKWIGSTTMDLLAEVKFCYKTYLCWKFTKIYGEFCCIIDNWRKRIRVLPKYGKKKKSFCRVTLCSQIEIFSLQLQVQVFTIIGVAPYYRFWACLFLKQDTKLT